MVKLINTKWEVAAAKDVKRTLAEIKKLVKTHKWEDRKVYPYNYPINIVEFLEHFEDYENFTKMSKQVALSEINGLIDHAINPWLEYEEKEKVVITLKKDGSQIEVTEDIAEALIEAGAAE